MESVIYPGTYDPITKGHIDIVSRASKMFGRVLFAVAQGVNISTLFNMDERIALAAEVLSDLPNVEVISFNGLVTEVACEYNVKIIIRGLRTTSDCDYELNMARMNRMLYEDVETIFITSGENYSFISSTLVREIAILGGDLSSFVPAPVEVALKQKFS